MISREAISAFLRGVEVREDKYLPEFKEAHRQERKWARRVRFERYRRFDVRQERVVFFFNGVMFVHPSTLKVLLAACERLGAEIVRK